MTRSRDVKLGVADCWGKTNGAIHLTRTQNFTTIDSNDTFHQVQKHVANVIYIVCNNINNK